MAKPMFRVGDLNPYGNIPEGYYRARIIKVEKKTFKSGNKGFELTLDIYRIDSEIKYYLTILPTKMDWTIKKFGRFFDSFCIEDRSVKNYESWVGKIGVVEIIHGEDYYEYGPSVKRCISRKEQRWIKFPEDRMVLMRYYVKEKSDSFPHDYTF